ncbi:MAG: (2E,6E)-farnesyl diphosphate synthase [Gammaproteobacteria bacterium]|nr:(2E,6E)-farnesyl diphosphate synthase [Gammaproteobacteria bacterium]
MSDFKQQLKRHQQQSEQALHRFLPSIETQPQRLHEAMHYAVMSGGKRIRPTLTYATGLALGVKTDTLDAPACALELIHAYSLVHDDLPAMDDDDLRRGRPTCHKQFDEASAILVGDALQTLAFELLADPDNAPLYAEQRLRMIQSLSHASGSLGMVGGQAIDLDAVGNLLSQADLEAMHRKKTGALIRAAVRLGALCAPNIDDQSLKQLDHYAAAIGLTFQIVDDILDVTSDTQTLGKPQGSDIANNKPTYPALLGLAGAQHHAKQVHQQALTSLEGLDGDFQTLRSLADYILQRRF